MARAKQVAGTRVPEQVLEAADAHNASSGGPVGQAANYDEFAVASKFAIHLRDSARVTGASILTIAGETYSGKPVEVLTPLDHPAVCKNCLATFGKRTPGSRRCQPILVAL